MNSVEGQEKAYDSKRLNKIRWAVVLIYLVLVLGISFLPMISESLVGGNMYTYSISLTAIVVIGTFVVIAAVFSPYFIGRKGPVVPDGMLVDGVPKVMPSMPPYIEAIRFDLMIWITAPLVIVFAALVVILPSVEMFIIMGVTMAFLLILIAIFGTLEVRCDNRELSFRFGPIGKRVPIDDIVSIRPTSVHALRDFMGYGLRVGPDGTIGYIVSGNVGVRISLRDKKEYVVTIPNPQDLVNYVRMVRKSPRR
jgi:hypothetical protein